MGGLPRRRFLKLFAYGTGGLLIAGSFAYQFGKDAAGRAYRRLVELPRSPVLKIEEDVARALMSATSALLPPGFDAERYDDFFRYKAQNIPGYGRLYNRFRETADARARSLGAKDFASAPDHVKAAVLEKAAAVRAAINSSDRVSGLRFALFDREWLLFERYLVREILTLFSRTDAWLLSGYGPYPGVPRGLETYTRAPGASE